MPADTPLRTSAEIEAELDGIDNNTSDLLDEDIVDEPATDTQSEAESEAGARGWVPKNQYKGDPNKWVDAVTFLARGQRYSSNLQREVEQLKKQLADFEGTKKAFVKFHEESMAKKDQEIKEAISALRVQRSQATREGDDDLAIQLEDRIELLREQQKEVKAIPATAPIADNLAPEEVANPILQEWIEDGNSWFKDDPKLRDFSVKLTEEMLRTGEPLRGRRLLDKVSERMKEEFPRRFRTAATTTTNKNLVESGSPGTGGSTPGSGRSERELPAEDRAIMKQLIAGGFTTKEKFLQSYFSRN
jgi:hypothetical protein